MKIHILDPSSIRCEALAVSLRSKRWLPAAS